MNRRQIQRLCYPGDKTGRISRRRLQALARERYINKHRREVVHPGNESSMPVFFLAKKGRQFLAEHTGDDAYLLKPVNIPQPHLSHYLAVTETHITLDAAIEGHDTVSLGPWYGEHDIINTDEPDREKYFTLFTEILPEPRLVCVPDAAFQLEYKGHRGVFLLEQDRSTSGHKVVAARKHRGYHELQLRGMHRKLFPTTTRNTFIVLCIAPDAKRRDALRRAFRDRDGANLWRFAAVPDVTKESILHADIWYRCERDAPPGPLVRK